MDTRLIFLTRKRDHTNLILKGSQRGPLLVLVSPCFRENVNVRCKIGSFLCSLDNFLLKNAIVFSFGNQISKWRSFEKKGLFLTYFSHFLVTREKTQKSFGTYPTYIHTRILLILLTFFFFFAFPILQKLQIYHVWFLFGVTPGVDSFSRHFGAINK